MKIDLDLKGSVRDATPLVWESPEVVSLNVLETAGGVGGVFEDISGGGAGSS